MEWSIFLDSEETIHSAEINDTSYEPAAFSTEMKQKKLFWKQKFKMADSKKLKSRQFSIFLCENFMDWSLGW